MLVSRVVNYLLNTLQCEEKPSKIAKSYRKFKAPKMDEFFFVTDSMIFVGPSFKNCRPARTTMQRAHTEN